MSKQQDIAALIKTVEANSWAIELPQTPTFPAAAFDIDVQPERRWVLGVDYARFFVTIYLYNKSKAAIMVTAASMRSAFEAFDGYIEETDSGDASYEDFPNVYGYFMNFTVRGHTG